MHRVYLDQWAWIDLTRAAHGRTTVLGHAAALAVAREASARGLACFPISGVHYMELAAGASSRQRNELTSLIQELSGYLTMISWTSLLEHDLEVSLGLDSKSGPFRVFGHGVAHAFGSPNLSLRLVSSEGTAYRDPTGELGEIERWGQQQAEWYMLAGFDDESERPTDYNPRAHASFNNAFAVQEEQFAAALSSAPKQKRLGIHYARALLTERQPALAKVLAKHGAPVPPLPDSKEGLTNLLYDLPSLWNWTELTRLQHDNPQRRWQPQDFMDLQALTVAIIHCDIVVFDKHWSRMARRAKLDSRYDTRLCRLPELADELVGATRL